MMVAVAQDSSYRTADSHRTKLDFSRDAKGDVFSVRYCNRRQTACEFIQ